ncbi:response regulator [Flaviaesturariibacter amylovorans]|uniref:Response regulatory domain-containing protein n=1 Tax=Flaviaesturariibacter amylovorans TaxID=1084520 RepID=A0ABP8HGQ9_9BACT
MSHTKPLIYIVEDDADDRHLFKQAFAAIPGCQATIFASSDQFYRHMLSIGNPDHLPTLIVLDFNMPIINGGELLLRLKREESLQAIPVVVYSTGMLPILEETLRSYGAYACFVKSIDYREMEAMAGTLYVMAQELQHQAV